MFQTAKKKEIFRQQIKDYLDKHKKFNKTKKQREDLEERLTEIYSISKQKTEVMSKQKEQEVSNYDLNCSFEPTFLPMRKNRFMTSAAVHFGFLMLTSFHKPLYEHYGSTS
jgi:hypothetical protein